MRDLTLRWLASYRSMGIRASASVLLYFGLGMLLVVPRSPGESFWVTGRFTYGLLPLLFGCTLATICGRIAVHHLTPIR